MNSIMTEYYPTFRLYQALRGQLMDLLTDADLRFSAGDENPSLGALCTEIGEVQHAYIKGKVSVYLKAMGKPRTDQWQEWIA